MLTKTKTALMAAAVLASASSAMAQSMMGNGVPAEAENGYTSDYGQWYANGPATNDEGGLAYAPRAHRSRHHHSER